MEENFIWSPFIGVLQTVGSLVTFDYLVLGAAALLLLTMIITSIRIANTYEVKLLKSVTRINRYLSKNPTITEENLVQFNNIMKRVPQTLRGTWQEFVLYRDRRPSDYMSVTKCVDRPLMASAYPGAISISGIFVGIIALISFLLGLAIMYTKQAIASVNTNLYTFVTPLVVIIIGCLYISYLKARKSATVSNLYLEFSNFGLAMNKACVTLPEYIDYEILFTRKEIKDSIPVLQEYLDKRESLKAKMEEEQQLDAIKYEPYDFTVLDVDQALLCERAMKESEKFFKKQAVLQEQINIKENEKHNYQTNFDEVTKNYERKAQACRENLAQKNEQISKTSSTIELNYIKREHAQIQQELQQLEKDYELSSARFQKQQDELDADINKFKEEIDRRRNVARDAVVAECQSYDQKVHTVIKEDVYTQSKSKIMDIEKKKVELEMEVVELNNQYESNMEKIQQQASDMDKLKDVYATKLAELQSINNLKDYFASQEFLSKVNENFANVQPVNQERDAEQQQKEAEEANKIAEALNGFKAELQKMNEEIVKLSVENKQLQEENENLKLKSKSAKSVKVSANDNSELEEIEKSIKEENEKLKKGQKELSNSLAKTISELEKPNGKTSSKAEYKKEESKKSEEEPKKSEEETLKEKAARKKSARVSKMNKTFDKLAKSVKDIDDED